VTPTEASAGVCTEIPPSGLLGSADNRNALVEVLNSRGRSPPARVPLRRRAAGRSERSDAGDAWGEEQSSSLPATRRTTPSASELAIANIALSPSGIGAVRASVRTDQRRSTGLRETRCLMPKVIKWSKSSPRPVCQCDGRLASPPLAGVQEEWMSLHALRRLEMAREKYSNGPLKPTSAGIGLCRRLQKMKGWEAWEGLLAPPLYFNPGNSSYRANLALHSNGRMPAKPPTPPTT
jgi:hypothetical protein